jgi:hypothetical protein
MAEWKILADEYPGWPISDIQSMSRRERKNWIEVSRIKL